ncbi:uncharacterized protein LOC126675430 [Mercurialis annua]|uniref:uncharacterized protein LOC126675430 n=1 Tax=Mercurialis annua TaxID=3986 RepID=UPI00216050E1|nr:uncharacterized protein LOC126675430 [Mercurialis annua]
MMDTLYAKLYNKYDALKKKRIRELDETNKDQELKFLTYLTAAEELIQHLRNEKESLSAQISELRSQVASIRSSKDEECAKYQKQLLEENQKNKMLREEVDRVQKLQEQSCFSGNNKKLPPQITQVISCDMSSGSTIRMTRKRSREARAQIEECNTPKQSDQEDLLVRESTKDSSKARKISRETRTEKESFPTFEQCNEQQPLCCSRDDSGAGVAIAKDSTDCQFRALIECLLGMKLSALNQTEGMSVSAEHQSSGYSFSLTWVKKSAEGDAELLYRLSTLGTFERVAPEWMRSTLMFSTSMCPIFFERVSRVIKTHC